MSGKILKLIKPRVKAGKAQARRTGKHCGRPALRKFQPNEIETMQELRAGGTSIRKLAKDFETTQWMVARLMTPQANVTRLARKILLGPDRGGAEIGKLHEFRVGTARHQTQI